VAGFLCRTVDEVREKAKELNHVSAELASSNRQPQPGSAGREARTRRRMGQKEMAMTEAGKNRIMIFGPKDDGTYVVEFRTAAGEALAISIPRTECAVIRQTFREEHSPRPGCFAWWKSSQLPGEGSRDPARPPFGLPHSGGVLVGEPTRLTGAAGAAIREKV